MEDSQVKSQLANKKNPLDNNKHQNNLTFNAVTALLFLLQQRHEQRQQILLALTLKECTN
jgi:hypothetical protein